MTFAELANKIESRTKKQALWRNVIKPQFERKGFANFVIETITARLYKFGTDNQGKQLKTNKSEGAQVYSLRTIKTKRSKGQKTSNVTLRDTGKFYDSYKVQIFDMIFEINANFKKGSYEISDNFTANYSPKEFENAITGLTTDEIKEITIEFINKYIGQDLYELL